MAAFTYEQDGSTGISIRVAVPPATSKADVAVTALADRLRVSVNGHSGLDGELYYDVDPDETSWAIEGSGDARELVIELTKAEPVDWDEGLFRVATADSEPPPDLSRASIAKAASAETPASAEVAAGAAPASAATAEASGPSRSAFDDKHKKALEKLAHQSKEDSSKGEGVHIQTAQEIWADLMSGEKRLLTKDGIIEGADAIKAALGIDLTGHPVGARLCKKCA